MTMRRVVIPAVLSALAMPAMAQPKKELHALRDLAPHIQTCWSVPAGARRIASDATIRFSLRADGSVFGAPQITYAHRALSDDEKAVYTRSLSEAITRCAPFPLSHGLGNALAGKPITIRFRIP